MPSDATLYATERWGGRGEDFYDLLYEELGGMGSKRMDVLHSQLVCVLAVHSRCVQTSPLSSFEGR